MLKVGKTNLKVDVEFKTTFKILFFYKSPLTLFNLKNRSIRSIRKLNRLEVEYFKYVLQNKKDAV